MAIFGLRRIDLPLLAAVMPNLGLNDVEALVQFSKTSRCPPSRRHSLDAGPCPQLLAVARRRRNEHNMTCATSGRKVTSRMEVPSPLIISTSGPRSGTLGKDWMSVITDSISPLFTLLTRRRRFLACSISFQKRRQSPPHTANHHLLLTPALT